MRIILPAHLSITWYFRLMSSTRKTAYSLDVLAQLLGQGKKSPLYKVLVKEKKLTSNVKVL